MARVEKTVFLSYRRTNAPWALAIYQNLTNSGFDVFFDYKGIASGDFESVILGNIRSHAHFLVLLTPSALERCDEPNDWLRREIEHALEAGRNVVPVMLEGFDFGAPAIDRCLTGGLACLKSYNALEVPVSYFQEAMARLHSQYLSVALDAVSHPPSSSARRAADHQKAAAGIAPAVTDDDLKAQRSFERGFAATSLDDKLLHYDQAIRLRPNFAAARTNRASVRSDKGDTDGALRDADEAVRLQPSLALAYLNRGRARHDKGDLKGAIDDASAAIQLRPAYTRAFLNRAAARYEDSDLDGALTDASEAIRILPSYAKAYLNRGSVRMAKNDLEGAREDLGEAVRLRPNYAKAYRNRGRVLEEIANLKAGGADYMPAISDYQKYLALGGGGRNGDQREIEKRIRLLGARR